MTLIGLWLFFLIMAGRARQASKLAKELMKETNKWQQP